MSKLYLGPNDAERAVQKYRSRREIADLRATPVSARSEVDLFDAEF
jgi:hypothetical protein